MILREIKRLKKEKEKTVESKKLKSHEEVSLNLCKNTQREISYYLRKQFDNNMKLKKLEKSFEYF